VSLGTGTYQLATYETVTGGNRQQWTTRTGVIGGSWSHTLNEVGTAEIQMVGMVGDCCNQLGQLRPWAHTGELWSDGCLVFAGPVTSRQIGSAGTAVIELSDWSAWFGVRFVRDAYDHTLVPVPVLDFVAEAVTSGLTPPVAGLQVEYGTCDETTSRVTIPGDYQTVLEVLQGVIGTQVDMIVNGAGVRFVCKDECVENLGVLGVGTIVGDFVTDRPGYLYQTRAVVKGPDPEGGGSSVYGDAGGVNTFGLLVERRFDDLGAVSVAAATEAANGLIPEDAPVTSAASEGGETAFTLSCDAPFDRCAIVPGVCFELRLPGCEDATGTVRVRSVGATWGDKGEEFSVTVREIV